MPKLASRIAAAFDRIRAEKRTGLVTYVTAGDPDLARSADILCALDRAGADVLEVGIPFSEPLADGPVIQRATERALAAGATASGVLDLVGRVRSTVKAPIVLFTYANPVLQDGRRRVRRSRARGRCRWRARARPADRRSRGFRDAMAARDIDMIFLLSPTTTDARMKEAAKLGRGFLYGISRLGVTGTRDTVADGARGAGRAECGPRRRCRSRWASAFRRRSTCGRLARSPTRRWSAAGWSASSPRRERARIWLKG